MFQRGLLAVCGAAEPAHRRAKPFPGHGRAGYGDTRANRYAAANRHAVAAPDQHAGADGDAKPGSFAD